MINTSAKFWNFPGQSRSRAAMLGALVATLMLSGQASYTAQQAFDYVFGAPAHAQSNGDIAKYAKAAYEIEKLRQSRYAEAKRLMGGNVPGDVCRQQDIPGNVRSICDSFLTESRQIIERNGMTVAQFNELTRRKDRDANLQRQIQQELLRLQKGK
jgi:hypothetical protein